MVNKELVKYGELLDRLKGKIKFAQQKAIFALNNELLIVYGEIGNAIAELEQQAGWGGKIVDKLAADLKVEFPQMKGLSPRNLRYMRDFALAYPTFLQQAAANFQLPDNQDDTILQQLVAKLPWGHHQVLLTKLKEQHERAFYIRKAVENGWSRSILEHQIESNLYKSQGALVNNFSSTMPAYQSELSIEVFKDPYNFDFIMLGERAKEKDLEDALMTHVTKVLLELGAGFAFMGRQKRFDVAGREFFVDLLFYHTKLRRHIIIELKIGEFEPEYVSKMNVYLGLADDQLRGAYDEPAIGIILCKTNNKVVAEYALRDTSKPIGIAEYKITERLPDDIKGELPSIEEIEYKLVEEFKESINPIEEKLEQLKKVINKMQREEAVQKTIAHVDTIYKQFLMPFNEKCEKFWKRDVIPLFTEYKNTISINGGEHAFFTTADLELYLLKQNVHEIRNVIGFKGFKKAGTQAFDVFLSVLISFKEYKYSIGIYVNNYSLEIEKIYTQLPTEQETTDWEASIQLNLLNEIKGRIEGLDELKL